MGRDGAGVVRYTSLDCHLLVLEGGAVTGCLFRLRVMVAVLDNCQLALPR